MIVMMEDGRLFQSLMACGRTDLLKALVEPEVFLMVEAFFKRDGVRSRGDNNTVLRLRQS